MDTYFVANMLSGCACTILNQIFCRDSFFRSSEVGQGSDCEPLQVRLRCWWGCSCCGWWGSRAGQVPVAALSSCSSPESWISAAATGVVSWLYRAFHPLYQLHVFYRPNWNLAVFALKSDAPVKTSGRSLRTASFFPSFTQRQLVLCIQPELSQYDNQDHSGFPMGYVSSSCTLPTPPFTPFSADTGQERIVLVLPCFAVAKLSMIRRR